MDECRDDAGRLQGRHPVCPKFQRTAELLGRRWSAAVIRVALEGPVRFTEIRESVDGLSARLLTERLRELEAAGMIERRRDEATGAVVYRLTDKGRLELGRWVADSTPQTRLKDDFFIKLVLARAAGIADPLELIDRQRSAYLQALRELDDVAARATDETAALLVEGAALHLVSDLMWLELCDRRLTNGSDRW